MYIKYKLQKKKKKVLCKLTSNSTTDEILKMMDKTKKTGILSNSRYQYKNPLQLKLCL
jgi:hypothetical protein